MSNLSGVVREGWLKRVKNQKKRYFVLGFNKETGDAQLQYYENPKKFSAETVPKRVISLQHCLGIVKKVDEKFGNILALYTKEGIFRLIADTDELLDEWFTDLHKLHQMEYKNLQESEYDMVWKVRVIERGLGGGKNVTGSYKLCLKENTLFFINPFSQDIVIEEKLYHIRKFGYLENCVFMEFGRATALGPGEIWMEVDDPLIAQKIEDSLSRSVKPRPERKSMVEDHRINHETQDNNNESPKSRRGTFITNKLKAIRKGKSTIWPVYMRDPIETGQDESWDHFGVLKYCSNSNLVQLQANIQIMNVYECNGDTRPHSNSLSGTPVSSAEEQIVFTNGGISHNTPSQPDDEDSEERHYPKITPPVPSVYRTKSQSSGSFTEESFIPRRKGTLDLESKPERSRTSENNYANITRSKRRSERKQDINAVRQKFLEQYQTSSLPRRTSSSSSGDPTWRRSMGSENLAGFNYDSDKERESDREDGDAFGQESEDQYIKMNPRQKPITSDSSLDEPAGDFDTSSCNPDAYVPLKPPANTPDLYVQMTRPGVSAKKLRNSSARSSDSYISPEEGGESGGVEINSYVNMRPGLRHQPHHMTSSTSSDDAPGDERFDHLNRGVSSVPSDHDPYVNMSPQSAVSKLKKSHSQIQRSTDSAYMNVDINRSKSVGNRTPRFRIVSEKSTEDETEEPPRSYVNVKANDASSEPDANYANFVPQNAKQSSGKTQSNRRALNYASVEFPKDSPPRERGRATKNRSENYSKIDFQKSHVLADISSTRERQLHHL